MYHTILVDIFISLLHNFRKFKIKDLVIISVLSLKLKCGHKGII